MKLNQEDELINEIIVMMQQMAFKAAKDKHVKRSAHAKSLGVLKGYFKVSDNLPVNMAEGIFKPGNRYPVLIRISNSSYKLKKDTQKDVRGFAMKLKVADGKMQDFILVSTKHMPLRNIEGFHSALCLLNGIKPMTALKNLLRNTNFTELVKLIGDIKHDTSPLDTAYYVSVISSTPIKNVPLLV